MATQTDPRLEQAQRLIQQGKKAEARRLLVEIMKANPKDTAALYQYAQVANSLQEMERALKLVLKLDPLNYQARSALNKVQQRSIEQLRDQAATVSTDDKRPAGIRFLVGFTGVLLVILVGAIILVVLQALQDDDSTQAAAVKEATPTLTETQSMPTLPPIDTPIARSIATLPPTWTPSSTFTPRPTRTTGPTRTPIPTRTTIPTSTPTPIVIEAISLELTTYSRLFNEYTALSMQAGWAEDPTSLEPIIESLQAIIVNIQLSEYSTNPDIDPETVAFLDNFIILIEQELALLADHQQSLAQDTAATDTALWSPSKVAQQQLVRQQLGAMVGGATSTAEWMGAVQRLRTPTVTAIVLPSATIGE